MCNGISPVEDKVKAPAYNKEKLHITMDWSLELGQTGDTLCGLRVPLIGYGLDDVTCEECLSRVGSYGY